MEIPKITTIIPTYKRPKLLKRAIESAMNQTCSQIEIRVYDDASNDETEEVVQSLLKLDSRIKYIKHPHNIGMMDNYKLAISQVETPYFSLLSDDDYLYPTFCETSLSIFAKFPKIAFSSVDVELIDKNGSILAQTLSQWKEQFYDCPEGLIYMLSNNGRLLYPIGVMFDTQKAKEFQPDWHNQLRWDTDYILKIAAKYPFAISKKKCCAFLCHDEGFSTNHNKNMLTSAEAISVFINSTDRMCRQLLSASRFNRNLNAKLRRSMREMLRKEISPYLNHQFLHGSIEQVLKIFKIYVKRFYIDKLILRLILSYCKIKMSHKTKFSGLFD